MREVFHELLDGLSVGAGGQAGRGVLGLEATRNKFGWTTPEFSSRLEEAKRRTLEPAGRGLANGLATARSVRVGYLC